MFSPGFIRKPCFAQSEDPLGFLFYFIIIIILQLQASFLVYSLRWGFSMPYSLDWWSLAVVVDLPEHHQAASLKIVLDVPNVHQFRMTEASVQQKECLVFPRSVPQSCLWLLEAVPSTSLLVDFSDVHRQTPINHTWSLENCWTCSLIQLPTVSSVTPSSISLQINTRAGRVEALGCVALLCRLSPGS